MFEFRPVQFDDLSLARYQSLFQTCFSDLPKFEPETLKWMYTANPDGQAIGFDAFEGDNLAAHYVCIPTRVRLNGVQQNSLLSLNTATHPNHQGQGLFTKLAEMTYEAGALKGYSSIHGVANASSTPGFIRKLGFQLVQPLNAMIGMGSLGINFADAVKNTQFERVWAEESLEWRCNNPANPVSHHSGRGGEEFYARAFGRTVPVFAELSAGKGAGLGKETGRSLIRLFIGSVPNEAYSYSGFFNIPSRLRPSPLNLIFRSLVPGSIELDAGHVLFSFLDFDAY